MLPSSANCAPLPDGANMHQKLPAAVSADVLFATRLQFVRLTRASLAPVERTATAPLVPCVLAEISSCFKVVPAASKLPATSTPKLVPSAACAPTFVAFKTNVARVAVD